MKKITKPQTAKQTAESAHTRLPLIDELRGIAFVMMVIFHFCYDLSFFQIKYVPLFTHPFWIGFRIVIVLLFLGMVGASLSLNHKRGFNRANYLKRLMRLIAAASAISIATFLTIPDLFIFFGIIHMIAASSILALLFLFLHPKYRYLYGALGLILLILGNIYPLDLPAGLVWIWAAKTIPNTADYAPLIPWFGFVLIGMMAGWDAEKWADKSLAKGWINIVLKWCGRNALLLYLIHQPVLWAGFIAYLSWLKP